MRADDPRLADAPVPTHVTARMVAYSRRTQAYETRKEEATAVRLVTGPAAPPAVPSCMCPQQRPHSVRVLRQACAPLVRLFGEFTQKHGMWAVV
jgi:hypothetical protein